MYRMIAHQWLTVDERRIHHGLQSQGPFKSLLEINLSSCRMHRHQSVKVIKLPKQLDPKSERGNRLMPVHFAGRPEFKLNKRTFGALSTE